MKAIKVVEDNIELLITTLREINDKAGTHVFSAREVLGVCIRAERDLIALLGRKADAKGAICVVVSGSHVANAYKYKRVATWIKLERRSSDWFLVEGKKVELFPNQSGYERLSLTKSQDSRAVEALRTKYTVI